MHQENMVIVGCGHAGARAAQALRTNGWHGGITLVDGEGRTPYERPPLSKAVLKGESEAEDAPLFPADFLAKNDIHVLKGVAAAAIDRPTRQLRLSDGGSIAYHRLLLATGAEPRNLIVPGADLPGSHTLRSADDAARIFLTCGPGGDRHCRRRANRPGSGCERHRPRMQGYRGRSRAQADDAGGAGRAVPRSPPVP